ncbi:hypothetical protein MmiHf6_02840 [Methanimicrococcus hongohii]|uniref:Uncharacterized protein n=2 Tax=Methanimicrococcus hongohii TaxID=3028295 RepID=A0AA97A167_9EURY|nr:hypothetical protein MmiHf6_02840 [Methanimicrococcus sp. Hf6]
MLFSFCKVPSCDCLLLLPIPAGPASLQLSFSVAAWSQVCVAAVNQICVSACICSFFKNPFAFANVPLPPAVYVAAAACRFLFPLAIRFLLGSSCPQPREPHQF